MIFSRSLQITQEELKSWNLGPLPEEEGILETHFTDMYSGKFCDVLFSAPYFTHLRTGKLNPTNYGSLLVLDAYYCYNEVETLKILKQRMEQLSYPSEITKVVSDLIVKYEKYCNTFLYDWHLYPDAVDNVESSPIPVKISPTPTMGDYAQHERDIAENAEPIYGLVALYPCFRLWPFLFWKFGEVSKDNLYYEWITGNQSSGSSAIAVDNLITTYWVGKGRTWDTGTFQEIFKRSMYYEKNLFEEAAKTS
jgi:transcriptional activator, tenA family